MAEIFGLLKELTAIRAPEKVLVREEARHPITKHVNSISLIIMKEGKVIDKNVVEPNQSNVAKPIEVIDKKEETEDGADDETIRNAKKESKEELVEMPSQSHVYPLGIAEDVLVEIAGFIYPIDFVILDIKEDKKRPFILRTPFLTTAKAEIRFGKDIITLKSGKNKLKFHKIPELLYNIEEETKDGIGPVTPNSTVSRLILEWEERIKLHQEKEMEFNQWRSKVFNDGRSILGNEGSEVRNE
ncbi:zinc finger, CCHC-type containing protein [Tanacetum coccineum]|uniref:Zinc finger, CCHC-type containing protein n=1 Tax=Tanacetum coccineum TaxID=301880 RepID=A0ABQ5BH89_9ASTR